MASASMRAQLGQPTSMQSMFAASERPSALRNSLPDLPMNRLNRYVRLSFPSLTSAVAMRRILLGNGMFEHVEIANVLQFKLDAVSVPEPYFQTVQTGVQTDYKYGGTVSMQNNPYG
jgi:hypothetical protein